MPLAFRPDKTIPLWLDIDADIPEAERPVFLCKFVTEADAQRVEESFDEAKAAKTDAEAAGILRRAICLGVNGFRNMKDAAGADVPFAGPDSLAMLTYRELLELRGKVLSVTAAGGPSLKKP